MPRRIIRIYTKTKEGLSRELHISTGYRNTEGEIYLAENEICRIIERENEIPIAITEELSPGYSEFDSNEDIHLEVFRTKNDHLKRICLDIRGSLCQTIKSNNLGTKFNIDIDDGSEVNAETWTILSLEEIGEEIDINKEYYIDIN